MDILFTIAAPLSTNAGAPGITFKLTESYRSLGHNASVFSLDHLALRGSRRLADLTFPFSVAAHARFTARRFDVIDASGGDAWVYSLLRQRIRPLLVMRTHGLEERLAEHTMD